MDPFTSNRWLPGGNFGELLFIQFFLNKLQKLIFSSQKNFLKVWEIVEMVNFEPLYLGQKLTFLNL